MFEKFFRRFAKDQRPFTLVIPQDIFSQEGRRLELNPEVVEWCFENKVHVAKVYPNAGMDTGNGTILFGPFYVTIYDEAQRMLFKLKWC